MPNPPTKKKKKGGQSREELERLQREAEERERLEALLKMEREAEERQRQENELRDQLEAKERERMKKEAHMRLLAEKEATIVTLSTELSTLQTSFSSERTEMEDELNRMLQLRETLLNEISAQRSEAEEIQRKLLEDRSSMSQDFEACRNNLAETSSKLTRTEEKLRLTEEESSKRLGDLQRELESTQRQKEVHEREMGSKIKNCERELEKVMELNKTFQEVIEAREADDRKNVTLMQLLNNQLDDNKKRSQEVLDTERAKTVQLQRDLNETQTTLKQCLDEIEHRKKEQEQLKKQAEADLYDYKTKLDQLKFDMKYLHSELHNYKTQLTKQKQEAETLKMDSMQETQATKLSLESQNKKVEELEALMRRKDREHFDKVTFLNAQISNNRTIISQLQQKMAAEREERLADGNQMTNTLNDKNSLLEALGDDLEKRKAAASDVEVKLNSDIAILKTTVFQLQSALVEKERQFDSTTSAKDEEIRRLRRKLDEHFIPHRNEVEETQNCADKPIEAVLNDKVAKITQDLEITQRVALETETRLKAQISNQNHIIDSLQAELLKVKDEANEEMKMLQAECARLRQILDVNFIPYHK